MVAEQFLAVAQIDLDQRVGKWRGGIAGADGVEAPRRAALSLAAGDREKFSRNTSSGIYRSDP